MSYKKSISNKNKESERKILYGAFDFETMGLSGNVVFGTLQREIEPRGQRSEIFSVYSAIDMLILLRRETVKKTKWFAHNMEFDAYYLIDAARQFLDTGDIIKIELRERGLGNIFCVVFHWSDGMKIEIFDSMALFGFSLAVFLKQFSTVGDKLTLDFENENFDVNNPEHIKYAEQDTRGLLDAMVNFNDAFYDYFGVNLKSTISSTALAAFETTLSNEQFYIKPSRKISDFCRNAYFGGLVFITDSNEQNAVDSVDVNSMYPYVMRRYGVPAGNGEIVRGKMVDGKPGIYRAEFIAPDSIPFGCIGYRDKNGVCWPRGEFESYAFCFEIERALRWGYNVKIIEGVIFDAWVYPFKNFVDLCEQGRKKYAGEPYEIVIKLAQNSVYGKFGTGDDGQEICIFSDYAEIENDWLPYIHPITLDSMPGAYYRETERDTYYQFPHWAACITARARSTLLDYFEACEGRAYYGDTDSLKIPREIRNKMQEKGVLKIGGDYGDLKIDEQYDTFRAIGPKTYVYSDGEKLSGKAKGIPKKQRTTRFWESVFAGNNPEVVYRTMPKLSVAVKKNKRELSESTRKSSALQNSLNWFDAGGGKIKSVLIRNKTRLKQ